MDINQLRVPNNLPRHLNDYATKTIGAAIEVHRRLGPGFLEVIYQRALVLELQHCGLTVRRQSRYPIDYRDKQIGTAVVDLLVEDELVLELKAVECILPIHVAQLRSYLKAGAFQLGLVINFNVDVLRDGIRRVISSG